MLPFYLAGEACTPNTDLEVHDKFTGKVAYRVAQATADDIDKCALGARVHCGPARGTRGRAAQRAVRSVVCVMSWGVLWARRCSCTTAVQCRWECAALVAASSVRRHQHALACERDPAAAPVCLHYHERWVRQRSRTLHHAQGDWGCGGSGAGDEGAGLLAA